MTRGKSVALAVGVAAVAVLVLNGPAVWRVVAYVQVPISSGPVSVHLGGGAVSYLSGTDQMGAMTTNLETAVVESGTLTVHKKRHAWLPGQAFIIPDQACVSCGLGKHTVCFPRHVEGARFITPDGTRVELPENFRCTCTDPSHDGDSQ